MIRAGVDRVPGIAVRFHPVLGRYPCRHHRGVAYERQVPGRDDQEVRGKGRRGRIGKGEEDPQDSQRCCGRVTVALQRNLARRF